jgi:hypothetical protein
VVAVVIKNYSLGEIGTPMARNAVSSRAPRRSMA